MSTTNNNSDSNRNRNSLLFNSFDYMINHVGGDTAEDNNMTYIQDQSDIIDKQNETIPKSFTPPYNEMYLATPGLFGRRFPPKPEPKSDKYDAFGEFLYKNGLLDRSNVTRYISYYLNVDSNFRNKIPKTLLQSNQWIQLNNNPIKFYQGTNIMNITIPNTHFNVNDQISISGMPIINKILRMKFTNLDNNITKNIIEFTNGSSIAKINFPHQMSFNGLPQAITTNTNGQIIYDDNVANQYILNLDTSNLFIDISGIQGFRDENFINNIPISTLNTKHRVYIISPNANVKITPLLNPPSSVENANLIGSFVTIEPPYSDNFFYIQLPFVYNETVPYSITDNYNITITFNYYAGIPINNINAEYPINANTLSGFKVINYINEDGSYDIIMPQNTTGIINDGSSKFPPISHNMSVGGNNMYAALVSQGQNAYLYPNHYVLNLEQTYSDVVLIRMVSSEFPNVETTIKNYPTPKTNNILYWENLVDGNHIYSITVDPGNYSASELANTISNKIALVPRIASSNVPTNFVPYNYIIVDINQYGENSIVTFNSFNKAIVDAPFITIDPIITATTITTNKSFTITVQIANHNLVAGDIITINNAINYYGIPAQNLNKKFTVTSVIAFDRFLIQISNFNLIRNDSSIPSNPGGADTHGGNGVIFLTPNSFRLRFDLPYTIGSVLGFRKVGNTLAVTNYATVISNTDKYPLEPTIDELGNPINITNNALQLYGDKYILVVCTQFKGLYSNGNVKNAFAKILLPNTDRINKKIFIDTFAKTPLYFNDPITDLNSLEFFFYSPDGQLYDFAGSDHSFTLEIISLSELPKGTGINSFVGKIN